MEGGRKGPKSYAKAEQGARKERRSATGMSGEPKKGGHGGKFTWSGDQRDYDVLVNGAVDAGDPNFEDPDEQETPAPPQPPPAAVAAAASK